MRSHRQVWTGLLLVGLLVAVLACNGDVRPDTPLPPPPEVPTATRTSTPAPPTNTPTPPPPTSTPTPEPSWDPEGLKQPGDFDSYRSRLQVSWTGTGANGEGVIGSMEMTTEFVREPLAQHVSISGDYPQIEGMRIPQNQRLDLYYIDGAVYTNLLGRWQTRPADEDALIAFTRLPLVALDELVKGIGQATYRRNEFRNGVDTLRFDLDKMSFQVADSQGAVIEDGGGEVYVATEGNYPVSLDVVLSGVNLDIPADTREGILSNGTVEVAFDISSINEAFQVQVPEAALDAEPLPAASPEPLLLADIPVPDDALDLTNSPLGLRTFRSPRAWEVLALFYRDRMPKQGWRETQVEQAGEVTSLTYTKDSRTSTITIVPDSDSGGTAVWIAIRSE